MMKLAATEEARLTKKLKTRIKKFGKRKEKKERKKEKGYLIILTLRWALSSMKSSSICPKSAALPWEYNKVNLAKGCLQNVATILLPFLVSNKWQSMFLSAVTPENTSLPSSSLLTSYVGGSGGKNANFAATLDVTIPILFITHPSMFMYSPTQHNNNNGNSDNNFIYLLQHNMQIHTGGGKKNKSFNFDRERYDFGEWIWEKLQSSHFICLCMLVFVFFAKVLFGYGEFWLIFFLKKKLGMMKRGCKLRRKRLKVRERMDPI